MVFTIINEKREKLYKLFAALTFFFDLQNSTFQLSPNVAQFLKNSFIWEDETPKK